MVNNDISYHKQNGVFYTPALLARTLAEPLITSTDLRIFDPAYGEGALLLSAEKILIEKYRSRKKGNLYGCDLSPLKGKTRHLPALNLMECDFMDYSDRRKYDVILMNPPYVRHHYINKDTKEHYQSVIESILPLKRTSDLWAYFIVKATNHLNDQGSIGAILPWSFLHADYSIELRKWLSDSFREIKVLALGSDQFNDARERVVLVWMKGYGEAPRNFFLGTADNPTDYVKYHNIPKELFVRNRLNISFSNDASQLIERYRTEYDFNCFENYADVSIGVVTGADSFFVRHEKDLIKMGHDSNGMVPIFTNSAQLCGFYVNGNVPDMRLVHITDGNLGKFISYIDFGESQQYHLRSHSQRREPWYDIKIGNKPDAFFPYRVSVIPYLVLNHGNIQSTNSIHRIYFKNVSSIERKWIQVSLLSIPGQLSLEANSRVYGSGVLKIEPGSLKKSICYASKDRSVFSVYNQISRSLQVNDRREAMRIATDFINKSLNIDNRLSKQATIVYEELLSSRKKKKSATEGAAK